MRCILLTVLLRLGPIFVIAQEPPPPNLQQPVDYVKWLNEKYGKGITENAADGYEAAFKTFVNNEAGQKILGERMAWNAWTEDDRRLLRDWARQNEKCLNAFVAASRGKDCFFPLKSDSGLLIEVMLPSMAPFRNTARLLAARARLRLADGDNTGALEDISALLRSAAHLRGQPILISYLVGLAVGGLVYGILEEMPQIDSKPVDYEATLKMLRKNDLFTLVRPHKQMQTEKIMVWDLLQRHWRDANGDGKPDPVQLPEAIVGKGQPSVEMPATFEAGLKQVDDLYGRWNAVFSGNYQEAMRAAKEIEAELAPRKERLELIAIIDPVFRRVSQLQRTMAADRAATRIILGMHAFRAKNGQWPKDLEEALASEDAEFRKDPFSGKDFVYRIENGQPFLYSVGRDGKDDNGQRPAGGKKWDETGDAVFWPLAEK